MKLLYIRKVFLTINIMFAATAIDLRTKEVHPFDAVYNKLQLLTANGLVTNLTCLSRLTCLSCPTRLLTMP